MVRKKYKFDFRACERCAEMYTPTSARQKYCQSCFLPANKENRSKAAKKRWAEKFINPVNDTDATALKKRKINIISELISGAKSRAKRRGFKFDLSVNDLIIPDECPVLGSEFVRKTTSAYSLDRIDNTNGYVKGNVVIMSRKANSMKSDASPEELLKFADWIYKNYKS